MWERKNPPTPRCTIDGTIEARLPSVTPAGGVTPDFAGGETNIADVNGVEVE